MILHGHLHGKSLEPTHRRNNYHPNSTSDRNTVGSPTGEARCKGRPNSAKEDLSQASNHKTRESSKARWLLEMTLEMQLGDIPQPGQCMTEAETCHMTVDGQNPAPVQMMQRLGAPHAVNPFESPGSMLTRSCGAGFCPLGPPLALSM